MKTCYSKTSTEINNNDFSKLVCDGSKLVKYLISDWKRLRTIIANDQLARPRYDTPSQPNEKQSAPPARSPKESNN